MSDVEKDIAWVISGGWDTLQEQFEQLCRNLAAERDAAIVRAENAEAEKADAFAYARDFDKLSADYGKALSDRDIYKARLEKVVASLKPTTDAPLNTTSYEWYQWLGWFNAYCRAKTIAEGRDDG